MFNRGWRKFGQASLWYQNSHHELSALRYLWNRCRNVACEIRGRIFLEHVGNREHEITIVSSHILVFFYKFPSFSECMTFSRHFIELKLLDLDDESSRSRSNWRRERSHSKGEVSIIKSIVLDLAVKQIFQLWQFTAFSIAFTAAMMANLWPAGQTLIQTYHHTYKRILIIFRTPLFKKC